VGVPLREAHAHLAGLGESLGMSSLGACASVQGCLKAVSDATAAVRRAAAETGAVPFVRLTGARVAAWAEGRWPTLAELDGAAGGTPCVVMSFDHHAAAANSAAMLAAGLTPGMVVPPNGRVLVDERSGAPTGLLVEQAAYKAWGAAPEPAAGERRGFLKSALDHLRGFGYVEVHDLLTQDWVPDELAALERAGELPVRVWLYPPAAKLPEFVGGAAAWESARVRLAGGKLFADGTLNSRTALMLHRYAEPMLGHPRGTAMMSPAAIVQAFEGARALGYPLAVHAIGDGAVRMVLDCIEREHVASAGGPGAGGSGEAGRTPRGIGRHRVEHAEVIDAADVPRLAKLGVVASVQPCHLLADVEALRRYVPHRLDRVLPLRELIDSGCAPGPGGLLWFGSDAPIVGADPKDSVLAATMRRRAGDAPDAAIAPGQAVSEAEAWSAFRAPAG
jgi:hypothetical protein